MKTLRNKDSLNEGQRLYSITLTRPHRLDGEVAERPPRVREVAGLIPDRVIPKDLKM